MQCDYDDGEVALLEENSRSTRHKFQEVSRIAVRGRRKGVSRLLSSPLVQHYAQPPEFSLSNLIVGHRRHHAKSAIRQ
jgi:hypothetical protein